eukprot:766108-Amphidinium_carterae.1
MANLEALAAQLNALQTELQQQYERQTRDRLPSLVDTKGSGKPATFSGKEDEWHEWSVRFESFVVGVMQAVLSWAAEQDTENRWADVQLKFGTAAPAADHIEDVLAKAGQLYVALQQLTSKEAFDVLRNAPMGAGLEGWRRLVRRYDPSTSQKKRVMLRSILNPGEATSVASLRSAMEKWEEQVCSHERKKDASGVEEKIPESILMATLESLCPASIEAHLRLNHSRLRTYRARKAAADAPAADDPMDASGLWQTKGKGGK